MIRYIVSILVGVVLLSVHISALAQSEITDSASVDISLADVIVSATRPTTRLNATGMIISVNELKRLNDKGLDRILNVCPGVKVSDAGEISINGIGGVSLFVGDKQINLSGSQLTDYLKSLQGSEIKDIEVISNPTSAYDAEGTGGIIRVNLAKRHSSGLSGFISSAYRFDSRSSYRETASITWGINNLTLHVGYTYSNSRWVGTRFTSSSFMGGTSNSISEDFKTLSQNNSFSTGLDWQIKANTYLGIEYNGSGTARKDQDRSYTIMQPEAVEIKAPSRTDARPHNNSLTLNLKMRLNDAGETLKLVADYSDILTRNSISTFSNSYYSVPDETLLYDVTKNQVNHEKARVASAKIDYLLPLSDTGWQLSMGSKFSHVSNRYSYRLQNDGIEDKRFCDNFHFSENLYALYTSTDYASDLFDANSGLRSEFTVRHCRSVATGEVSSYDKFHLFPSIFLLYKPSSFSRFRAYYGMRIRRPSYTILNPFTVYITDVSYKVGNPGLRPMIDNNIELTYIIQKKFQLSVRGVMTSDRIVDYSYSINNTTVSTFTNLNSSRYWYFSGYAPWSYRFWTASALINLGWQTTGESASSFSAFQSQVYVDNYLKATDNLGFEINFRYSTPFKNIYVRQKNHTAKLDLLCDYSINHWSMSIGIYDCLNTTRRSEWHSVYSDVITDENSAIGVGRELNVSLKYHFSSGRKTDYRQKDASNSEEINRI